MNKKILILLLLLLNIHFSFSSKSHSSNDVPRSEVNDEGMRGGGGGGDILICKDPKLNGIETAQSLSYFRTQFLEKEKIIDNLNKVIDFSMANFNNFINNTHGKSEINFNRKVINSIKKKNNLNKNKSIKFDRCLSVLELISDRLSQMKNLTTYNNLLSSEKVSKKAKDFFTFLSSELNDFIKLIKDSKKSTSKSAQLTYSYHHFLYRKVGKKLTYLNDGAWKQKWNLLDIEDEQLVHDLPSNCSELKQTIIHYFTAKEVNKGKDLGKIDIIHHYDINESIINLIDDGPLNGDFRDEQCSFLYLHEFLRQYLKDSYLIDFYTRLFHSKYFFENNQVGHLVLAFKEGFDHITWDKLDDTNKNMNTCNPKDYSCYDKSFHQFNPFIFLSQESIYKIFPLKKFLEVGSVIDEFTGFQTPFFNFNTSSSEIMATLMFPKLYRREFTVDILNSYLVRGPTLIIKNSQKIEVGDQYIFSGDKFTLIGFFDDNTAILRSVIWKQNLKSNQWEPVQEKYISVAIDELLHQKNQ